MPLAESAAQAWEERTGPVVLTTVDKAGVPNAVYITSLKRFGEDRFVIADNYFKKTRDNVLAHSKGSLLFLTKSGKSVQLKGPLEYLLEGPIYEDMKSWLEPQFPGIAAVVLTVDECFSGGQVL